MGMTMTEKILARHAGADSVRPGEMVMAEVDLVMGNDITTPVAVKEFYKYGFKKVFNPEKVAVVLDHFVPCKDIRSAEQCKVARAFAKEQQVAHFFDTGNMGIEHALLPEQGLVKSGDLVIGADSHTCTYGALGAFSTGVGSTDMAFAMATGKIWLKVPPAIRFVLRGKPGKWVSGKDVILYIIGKISVSGAQYKAMEFTGEGLKHLSMDDRFTMANMAIEAGGKNALFETDAATQAYESTQGRKTVPAKADPDAVYEATYEIDLSAIRPVVSFPHSPDNTHFVDEIGEVKVDQVVIGSCTNGRESDMEMTAKVLKGKKVHPDCRTIIIPATQKIYMDALNKGYIATFIEAGCAVSTPTCGPCLGGYMGVLGKGERAASTTNRNFVGRMGHKESEVYLVSPAVAAATAIAGKIVAPED